MQPLPKSRGDVRVAHHALLASFPPPATSLKLTMMLVASTTDVVELAKARPVRPPVLLAAQLRDSQQAPPLPSLPLARVKVLALALLAEKEVVAMAKVCRLSQSLQHLKR